MNLFQNIFYSFHNTFTLNTDHTKRRRICYILQWLSRHGCQDMVERVPKFPHMFLWESSISIEFFYYYYRPTDSLRQNLQILMHTSGRAVNREITPYYITHFFSFHASNSNVTINCYLQLCSNWTQPNSKFVGTNSLY